ncbi:TonB-dependent receptor plug domain-containing protein [Enhygromyxa salina]|nr:TonB-dependent receptor [Enhygromyxa salina]
MFCVLLVPRLFAGPQQARVPEWVRPGDEVSGEASEDERVIVVSTGTRTEHDAATAPVATEVITREEIVGSGARNVADALEESGSSVQTSTGFNGTSLRLRGLDAEQVLILVDGQRVTGRIGGAIDLRRFNVENVERIEVVQGAGSVLYGADALGGVVNIVTRTPEPGVEVEGRASYASRTTVDASARVAGGGRRWGLSGSGGYHRSDGWDADPSDIGTTGDGFGSWNVGVGARFEPVAPLRLRVSGDYLRRSSSGVDVTSSGAIIDRRNLTETSNTTLRGAWRGANNQLEVVAHHNFFRDQFRQDQRGDDALDQYQPTNDHIGQIGVQLEQVAGHHLVTTGVDLQLEWLETSRVMDEQGSSTIERQRFALFAQDEWSPGSSGRYMLVPAVRVDFDSHFGTYPTGRLALLVRPLEQLMLRVGYGRGYRAPSFRDMYLAFANPGVGYRVSGNPGLRPEQAWTLDLGATWTPTEHLLFGLGVFDNRLRDLITTDVVTQADTDGLQVFGYVNIGTAYTRGVEAKTSVEFLRHFMVTGSYTWLDARDQINDLPLVGRSRHQGALAFEFHQRRWGTRLFARAAAWSPRPYTSDDGDASGQALAPAYATVDARLSQGLLRYLTLFVGAENLLDAGDAEFTLIAPRSFYAGLSVAY